MRQLYEVGEQVIRQATTYTSYNGEYQIIGVISAEEMKQLHPFMKIIDGWYYELEGFNVLTLQDTIANHTFEGYLRKKHNPSSMSYQELMTNLSTKIQERI